MISGENRHLRMIFKLIAPLMMLLVFLPSFPVYALDSNYVISEYNGWIDVCERIDYEKHHDGFDGFLKYISDEENGCFYLYFSFYDVRLAGFDDDNTVISFDVKNDINSYHFAINKHGFINTGDDEKKNIKITYNFDNCSESSLGGEILIGFELINNIDRQQFNYINCEYAGGNNETSVLFTNFPFDMYIEPTTVKQSATKSEKTTSASKSVSSGKSASNKADSTKNNKEVTEKSTKYTPSGTVSRAAKEKSSEKFSASKVYSSEITDSDTVDEEKTILNNAENTAGTYKMSKTAVIMLITAGVIIIGGIAFIIAGAVLKNKKGETEVAADSMSE